MSSRIGNALLDGSAWLSGGKTIVFGLVGGYLGVEIAKWIMEVHVKTGDSYAVPVAVAIALGRLGCLTAGCCYGTPSTLSWAIDFGDGVARHPTQVYEAAFHVAAALLLFSLQRRDWLRLQRFKLYVIGYLAFRFATEWIRPEPHWALGLTGYQWAALALLPLFALLWIRDQRLCRLEAGGWRLEGA